MAHPTASRRAADPAPAWPRRALRALRDHHELALAAVTLLASPSLSPTVNTPVQFTATATSAAGNITGYFWSFGDGTTRFTTGPNTSHVYGSTGRKFVRVEVTNAAGQRGEATIEVNVQP